MADYHYKTCCVDSTAEDIDLMVEWAKPVMYTQIKKNVSGLDEWAEGMGYTSRGLTLRKDYHVRYYKSSFNGVPCYFIVHSAIEYIFTEGGR